MKKFILLLIVFPIFVKANVIIAVDFNKKLTSELNILYSSSDKQIIDNEIIDKYNDSGITVTEKREENYSIINLVREEKNIDLISNTEDSLNDYLLLFKDNPQIISLFKIKKGFFKSYYEATFNINNDLNDIYEELNLDKSKVLKRSNDYIRIYLPNKTIKNNADNVSEDGMELTWNIDSNKDINISFELYNIKHIYASIFAAGAILLMFISSFLGSNKKSKQKEEIVYDVKNMDSKDIGELDTAGDNMDNKINSELSI